MRHAADEAIGGLTRKSSQRELDALRDAFVPHLVRLRLDDAKRVRQPARRADLPPEADRLIRALIQARLLTARGEDGESIVEVAHEALFEAWPTLAAWLQEEHAFLADLELVKSAYLGWRGAADREKGLALLHGLLLSRASTWLLRHPRRFDGPEMQPLRAFIGRSRKAAQMRSLRTQALVGALVAAIVVTLAAWRNQEWLSELRYWSANVRGHTLAAEVEYSLKPGDAFRECADCPTVVVVPAGDFQLGSPSDVNKQSIEDQREGPQHEVVIANPFAVGRFALTFEEWDACAAHGDCDTHIYDSGWARSRQPATDVNWDNARSYVAWLSRMTGKPYRLLSEAEYEYAARAGTTTTYSFGDDSAMLGEYAWFLDNSGHRAHPVGEKKPNAFGLYDMHGNVEQWVEDCWHESYYGAPRDGSAWTSGDCTLRVVRGGSWLDNSYGVRSASRYGGSADFRKDTRGFRVARTLTP